uniref:Uncharacterized protein n=1 Tax=Cannabis sativa TaxID=3483 RepID=A0A803Q8Q4_CANSA
MGVSRRGCQRMALLWEECWPEDTARLNFSNRFSPEFGRKRGSEKVHKKSTWIFHGGILITEKWPSNGLPLWEDISQAKEATCGFSSSSKYSLCSVLNVPYYGNWLKEDSKVKHCFEFLMAPSIKKRPWEVEGNRTMRRSQTNARAKKVGEIRGCCKGNRSLGEDTRKGELTLTIGEDSVVYGNKKNFVEVVPSHQKRCLVSNFKENQVLRGKELDSSKGVREEGREEWAPELGEAREEIGMGGKKRALFPEKERQRKEMELVRWKLMRYRRGK